MAMHIGGVVLMLISRGIVLSVAKDTKYILDEMAGFIQFIAGIIGIMSVLAMVAAGILLIVSVDEGLKDRAKENVVGTIVTLVVAIASYSMIAFPVHLMRVQNPHSGCCYGPVQWPVPC